MNISVKSGSILTVQWLQRKLMKYEKIMDNNVCKAMKIPHLALSDELKVRVRVFNATVNTISAIS
jgi:hypothetical protein